MTAKAKQSQGGFHSSQIDNTLNSEEETTQQNLEKQRIREKQTETSQKRKKWASIHSKQSTPWRWRKKSLTKSNVPVVGLGLAWEGSRRVINQS